MAGGAGQLALGTVQFGQPYGLAGSGRRVPEAEACAALRLALGRGIGMLDTAPAYGESEAVLGRCLGAAPVQIVTKTEPGAAQSRLSASLERLRRPSVYGLLVHRADDLLGAGGARLYESLVQDRAEGRTAKIGASVYTRAEIDALLARYALDVVQLPLSLLDQRLSRDGTLARLKDMKVEIHARSVFLQGLILMEPQRLPPTLAAARGPLERLRAALRRAGASPLEAALAYVRRLPEVDRIVVGVDSAAQLLECLSAVEKPAAALDFSAFACDDEAVLDPRGWQR